MLWMLNGQVCVFGLLLMGQLFFFLLFIFIFFKWSLALAWRAVWEVFLLTTSEVIFNSVPAVCTVDTEWSLTWETAPTSVNVCVCIVSGQIPSWTCILHACWFVWSYVKLLSSSYVSSCILYFTFFWEPYNQKKQKYTLQLSNA